MNVTEAIQKLSDEEFKTVLEAANPIERVWFHMARAGTRIYTSEYCPKGMPLSEPPKD